MTKVNGITKEVHRALEFEPRINVHRHPITVGFVDGAALLEGEVASVAAKKLALEIAAGVEGVRGVIDRLRVASGGLRGDGAIRDAVCGYLMREPELKSCAVSARVKGRREQLREAPATDAGGSIEVAAEDGVVTLEGTVISLTHKRVAGVLAWWTTGARDVVNALAVQPDEEDNDAEVVDALHLVLEMDPFVQAGQVRAKCRNYVVTLDGCVRSPEERSRVEEDAWCLFAVDQVINRIEVRS